MNKVQNCEYSLPVFSFHYRILFKKTYKNIINNYFISRFSHKLILVSNEQTKATSIYTYKKEIVKSKCNKSKTKV